MSVPATRTTDPRWQPYERRDGWAQATRIHPNPDGPGWLCICGAETAVFYGQGPDFHNGRYVPDTDTRVCSACHARTREMTEM